MEQIDLKQLRIEKNLTQREMAELFGCNQNFISDIETGKKALPPDKLAILKARFGDHHSNEKDPRGEYLLPTE